MHANTVHTHECVYTSNYCTYKVYLLQKMIPMTTAAMTAAIIRTRRTITTAAMVPPDAVKGVIKQRETHILDTYITL